MLTVDDLRSPAVNLQPLFDLLPFAKGDCGVAIEQQFARHKLRDVLRVMRSAIAHIEEELGLFPDAMPKPGHEKPCNHKLEVQGDIVWLPIKNADGYKFDIVWCSRCGALRNTIGNKDTPWQVPSYRPNAETPP